MSFAACFLTGNASFWTYLCTPPKKMQKMKKKRFFGKHNLAFLLLLAGLINLSFVWAWSKGHNRFTESERAREESNPVSSANLPIVPVLDSNITTTSNLYDLLGLSLAGLNRQVFEFALNGFYKMKEAGKLTNEAVLSIADFSKPSNKKRLYIIDLKANRLLFNTYVAHGVNSGTDYAHAFSNAPSSNKSSLGFYITADTYIGKNGYSMHLLGQEKGFNDNAFDRDIVMHAANYVNEAITKGMGHIGRSWGCPAVPPRLNKPIIDKIKNGTCFFIYAPDKNYISQSQLITAPVMQPTVQK
jgi:hypothetical protein